MTAPNPWRVDSDCLNPEDDFDAANVLDAISELILAWPGEQTVKLEGRKRHERLVQIIAGYPEIDVGIYPLDWPLNKKSITALKLTRFLDSITSPCGKTSLRSSLINKSQNLKGANDQNFERGHRRLLSILLAGIRSMIDIDKDQEYLWKEEERFLVALHSNRPERVRKFWPVLELNSSLGNDNIEKSKVKYIPLLRGNWNKNYHCDGWKDNSDLDYYPDKNVFSIKLCKIQDWIKHWSSAELLPNYQATLVRGASAILESIMSSLRHTIIRLYGVESIIVDGGGRIEFIGDEYAQPLIQTAFIGSFLISDKRKPYYNYEIEKVARILSGKGFEEKILAPDFRHLFEISGEIWKDETKKESSLREWSERILPPVSFSEVAGGENTDTDMRIISDPDCIACSSFVEKPYNFQKEENPFRDLTYQICPFHRLLYQIGIGQRMVDSTTKKLGKKRELDSYSGTKINAMARLDLNSLGNLFKMRYSQEEYNQFDVRRRRSIRFNAKWWEIISQNLDIEEYQLDRMAAWVAAGDDLILVDKIPEHSHETVKMNTVLLRISEQLEIFSQEELSPFLLSFGAGIARSEKFGEGVTELLSVSKRAEKIAKELWKAEILKNEQKRWMIQTENGFKTPQDITPDENNIKWLGESLTYTS